MVNALPNGDYIGFWDYWQQHGGLEIFGYPKSGAYFASSMGKVIQYFERARFEYAHGYGVQLGLLGNEISQAP